MRRYDTTFIIDGQLSQSERETLIGKAETFLVKQGGVIEKIVRWGNRRLAYEINKRTNGYYVIFYYSAAPSVVKPFENELRLMESVLRYMTIVFKGDHPEYIKDEDAQNAQLAAEKEVPLAEVSDEKLSDDEDEEAIDYDEDEEMEEENEDSDEKGGK